MKITIITAVYNNYQHIEECIKSVHSQSYRDIEHIIVDGGSEDGTLAVLDNYHSQISYFISEPDEGMYDALNKGISLASGDVIGLLHSDDIFANSNIIETVAGVFLKTNADGIYGDLVYVDKENTDKIFRYWKSSPFNQDLLKKGWMPPHPTLFLKKNLICEVGKYNIHYKIAADYDFMIRVLKKPGQKFEYIPQIITKMRTGGASNRSLTNIFRKSLEDYKVIRKNNIGGLQTLFLKNFKKLKQFIYKNQL